MAFRRALHNLKGISSIHYSRPLERRFFDSARKGLVPGYDPNSAFQHPMDMMKQLLFDNDDAWNIMGFGEPKRMMMDIKETDDNYELFVELPGVHKKDLLVSHQGNRLTIAATREVATKEKHHRFLRLERYNGEMSRTLVLPENSDKDKLTANLKNGILTVKIPKTNVKPTEETKFIDVGSEMVADSVESS